MCGLFAWMAPDGPSWDEEQAITAVRGAADRGPHGWGIAQGDFYLKKLGPMITRGGGLEWSPHAGTVIGHCRLATTPSGPGGYDDETALQPIYCKGLAVAHNGVVRNHAQLARDYNLQPRTGSDSEVAGLYLAWALHGATDVLTEAAAAIGEISPRSPLALLALLPGNRILAATRGLPLHTALRGPGIYFSSRPMPDSTPMARDSVMLVEWRRANPHPNAPASAWWQCAPLRAAVA